MSLKKKIVLGFFISAFVIGILVIFEYVNFLDIRKEIRNLEITDTVRSKSLQLRRHEKNFFLYPAKAAQEAAAVRQYLSELERIAEDASAMSNGALQRLRGQVSAYKSLFAGIETLLRGVTEEFDALKPLYRSQKHAFALVEIAFYERPLQGADFLMKVFGLKQEHRLIVSLRQLDSDILALRRTGEDIIAVSKELDGVARGNAERSIRISQIAILLFFPLFLASGIGMLFLISRSVVNRLRLLMDFVEETGKGHYSRIAVTSGRKDEVGMLMEKFNDMDEQLALREEELARKNRELLQTKKLAAIGTLASGVAHELNNPLNNIHLSAQVLLREVRDECSPFVKETLNDILGQSIRVKGIVGDLLEYARGREPSLRETGLLALMKDAYERLSASIGLENVSFSLHAWQEEVLINCDPEQMERVFINLFTNAVEAMQGSGELKASVLAGDEDITITVSDTGKGLDPEDAEKVFEPFYTTKDKGTGLGLAIVFNIIKKHNGDITVSSEKEKGTAFRIVLPNRRERVEL